ncbi:hypothetical protein BDN71DRAFT_1485393 [Pleurotus eryngii]|uniref:CxC2-like cysteine cluster KDZ transposase-associated domain-containing protein n=1 Tax=Pleurotus eryngii TaxID=5323 RepID=A0A9P5ZGH7_PLEER|nr:hypothetical protein BDN71DRAFT_1485393 [Pleurotus eryngii]
MQSLHMSRKWCHLQQLKWMARGHDPEGVDGTKPGELAVLCPACPQPGMNLPAVIEEDNWLHALFIGIDANFHLKQKNISTHVTSNETPVKKSSCVSHKAVNDADKHPARGLVVNGVGTVECTRHDFKHPLSVGDLQHGERYVNMDYIFFSSIKSMASKIPHIVALYDIACQWHIHLCCRYLRVYNTPHLQCLTCQAQFSFNYTPSVGQTDREAPERGWDYLNPAANQTKEMGLGLRRNVLENLMGD